METITCGNIRFSPQDIIELDGVQVMASIPKADIMSIGLCYGQSIEKPVLQIAAGILMTLFGFIIGVWPVLGWLSDFVSNPGAQKSGNFLLFTAAIPLILIGICLIAPAFRMCDYLLVVTGSGRRKLPIKSCSPSEVVNAGKALGYLITARVDP